MPQSCSNVLQQQEQVETELNQEDQSHIAESTPRSGHARFPCALYASNKVNNVAKVTFVDTIMVSALPLIKEDHPSNGNLIPWVLTSYTLSGAVCTPLVGGLSAIFSKTTVATGISILYIAGILGGAIFGRNIVALVIFRGLQGLGISIFIVCYDVIKQEFPDKIVPPLLGIISSMFSVGASTGLLGGAALLDALNGRYNYVFYVIGPITSLACIAFVTTMSGIIPKFVKLMRSKKISTVTNSQPKPSGVHEVLGKLRDLDWIGTCMLFIGPVLLLTETKGWKSAIALSLLIVGSVTIVLWVLFELWVKNPLVPMRLLASRNMFFLTVTALLLGFAMFSLFQELPFLLQSPIMNFKYTEQFDVGILLFIPGVIMLVIAPLVGMFSRTVGAPLVQTTSLLIGVCAYGMLIFKHDTKIQLVISAVLQGLQMGGTFASQMTILADSCTMENFAGATSLNSFFRTLGGAISPVVIKETVVYDDSGSASAIATPTEQAYKNAFICITVVSSAAVLASMCISGHGKLLDLLWDFLVRKKTLTQEVELDPL